MNHRSVNVSTPQHPTRQVHRSPKSGNSRIKPESTLTIKLSFGEDFNRETFFLPLSHHGFLHLHQWCTVRARSTRGSASTRSRLTELRLLGISSFFAIIF